MSIVMRRKSSIPFQVKAISETGEFSGYGSVFGVKDAYGDIVIKGAFAKSLEEWGKKGKLPKMLYQHMAHEPIGVYSKMVEDDHGLYLEGKILIDAGPTEKRAYTHMKAGSIDGLSIGYSLAPNGYEYDKDQDAYLLKQVNLWEVSPVTFPANVEATIGEVKSLIDNPREFERHLRDVMGLTQSQAKRFMAEGYKALATRDVGDEELVAEQLLKSISSLSP